MTDKKIVVPRELLEELRDCAELCADDVRAHDLGEDSAEAEFRQVGRACDALLRARPADEELRKDAERQMIERCAALCDELDQEGNCDDYRHAARWCAERIRGLISIDKYNQQLAAAPDVQGGPVAYRVTWHDDTAEIYEAPLPGLGFPAKSVEPLYTAPRPAEQQPAPDVAGLVEALDKYEFAFKELFAQCCSNPVTNSWGKPVSMAALNNAHAFASSRLAAHRNQGGEE